MFLDSVFVKLLLWFHLAAAAAAALAALCAKPPNQHHSTQPNQHLPNSCGTKARFYVPHQPLLIDLAKLDRVFQQTFKRETHFIPCFFSRQEFLNSKTKA